MNLNAKEHKLLLSLCREDLRSHQHIDQGMINTYPNDKYIKQARENIKQYLKRIELLEKIHNSLIQLEPDYKHDSSKFRKL